MPPTKKKPVREKAPKWNAPVPKKDFGKENCVFPTTRTGKDTRSFKVGEVVCVGKDSPIPARFNGKGDEAGYYRVREGSMGYDVPWYDVGKIEMKTEKLLAKSVASQKGLPDDVGRLLKGYLGGKTRRRRHRKRNV